MQKTAIKNIALYPSYYRNSMKIHRIYLTKVFEFLSPLYLKMSNKIKIGEIHVFFLLIIGHNNRHVSLNCYN